jgi:antitoxin (DNA-binding transcriptional repressor) of toxin-antitoxin stability system
MPQTTMSSREFNQDIAAAKRAAKEGPVVVTDRGEPAFVLLSHAEYRRLAGVKGPSLADLLNDEAGADFDFDPPKLGSGLIRPVDLS